MANFDTGSPAGGGMADSAFEGFDGFDSSEREEKKKVSGLTKFAKSPFTKTAAATIPGAAPIVGAAALAGKLYDFFSNRKGGGASTRQAATPTTSNPFDNSGGTVSALQNTGGGGLTPVPGINLGGGGNKFENILLGKPGEFSQVPTDPNQQFFSQGQRTIAERFLDPSKDPILQRQLRGIGSRLGITAQGAKGALASDAVGAHSARAFDVFNRGFTGTRPITRFQEPGEGILSVLDQLRGSGEGGKFFQGDTPEFIKRLNPLDRDGSREGGSFFGARTPDFIRNLNPF